jgi:hypothetical protein
MLQSFLKKFLWLVAGLVVGAGVSTTFAESRAPASYQFKVLAVSEEDANEKAAEMLRTGALAGGFDTEGLLAATSPKCEEQGSDYTCETKLLYRL